MEATARGSPGRSDSLARRLRLVDIETWHSPVPKQYGVNRLPLLWLYTDGERVTSDTDAVLAQLARLR